jgi:hypothetical protein
VLAACDVLPSLVGERYSGVFVAHSIASDAAAIAFAQQVDCEVESITGAVDAATLRRALNELSDVYRGETIVVVAPRAMIRELVGSVADLAKPVLVAIDSSGWTVASANAGR